MNEYVQFSKGVEILYILVATASFKTDEVEHSTYGISMGGNKTSSV